MSRFLTSKLPSYLIRLHLSYGNAGRSLERDLIGASRFTLVEDVEYDNWNGGTYGHKVMLFLPLEELARVEIDNQADVAKGICEDLNKLTSSVENEFFSSVALEMDDEGDPDFQTSLPSHLSRW